MVLDTSAIVALLRAEPEAEALARAMAAATVRRVSAASYVEAAAVVDRVGDPVLSRRLDELLEVLHIELAPFDAAQAGAARAAYADFGKGSGHPAGLNLGDCLAYGLAKATGQPLLYVGDDFAQTDLRSALGTDQGG